MKVVDIHKGVKIVVSQEVEGMFHCENRQIFGESIEEVKYDLDDTMGCIEYAERFANWSEKDQDDLLIGALTSAFSSMNLNI